MDSEKIAALFRYLKKVGRVTFDEFVAKNPQYRRMAEEAIKLSNVGV